MDRSVREPCCVLKRPEDIRASKTGCGKPDSGYRTGYQCTAAGNRDASGKTTPGNFAVGLYQPVSADQRAGKI